MKRLGKLEKILFILMSLETMLIRIPLRPTFFSKKPRAILVNLQDINRFYLLKKKIEFYPYHRGNLRFEPITIRFDTHEQAVERFNSIEKMLQASNGQDKVSKDRLDMASPDPLAMTALQEFEEQKQLK
jgi:hypothetical protein